MDMQMVQKAVDWVMDNVGDRTTKQELLSKAQGSGLPDEAMGAMQDLPEGEHSKQDIVRMLQDKLMAKAGGTGGIGSMFGR